MRRCHVAQPGLKVQAVADDVIMMMMVMINMIMVMTLVVGERLMSESGGKPKGLLGIMQCYVRV